MQYVQGNRQDQSEIMDLCRTEIVELIDEWILNERNRRILKRRLIDGVCYEPLADEFGMSVRQIKNIVYQGEKIIFSHRKGG